MTIKNILISLLLLSVSCGGDILENDKSDGQGQSKIYIVGGLSAQTINATNTVAGIDVYYPDTDSWEQNITNIPIPVSFAAVVEYNGKIYIIGGFNNAGTAIANTQIYDTVTNMWSVGASMKNGVPDHPRANHSAVVYDGKIYVTRGTNANASAAWNVTGAPTNTLIYTISSNSWAQTGVVDAAVSNKEAVLVNDTIYYLGGKSATSTLVGTVDGILIPYNALTSSVTELAMTARVGYSAIAFTDSDTNPNILIIGGFSAITNTTGCYVFNAITANTAVNSFQYLSSPFTSPQQIAWTNLTNLPASLGFGSAVKTDSTVYYFGGASTSTATTIAAQNSVYSYNLAEFPSGGWTIHDVVMPHQRFGHTAVVVE